MYVFSDMEIFNPEDSTQDIQVNFLNYCTVIGP